MDPKGIIIWLKHCRKYCLCLLADNRKRVKKVVQQKATVLELTFPEPAGAHTWSQLSFSPQVIRKQKHSLRLSLFATREKKRRKVQYLQKHVSGAEHFVLFIFIQLLENNMSTSRMLLSSLYCKCWVGGRKKKQTEMCDMWLVPPWDHLNRALVLPTQCTRPLLWPHILLSPPSKQALPRSSLDSVSPHKCFCLKR